jgi:hypothetical protein
MRRGAAHQGYDPSDMFSWLRKRGEDDGAALDQETAALEREARAATDQARGHLFNRLGDLYAGARRKVPAVRYYGQAVDAYLGAGYVGPAAAMCRKILRIAPEAVRTHCTLACLAAHEGHIDEARHSITRFVEASQITHTEKLGIARLRLVAAAVGDEGLREHIASSLGELGDTLGQQRIEATLRGEVPMELEAGVWDRLLRAAAADPDDLWKFA